MKTKKILVICLLIIAVLSKISCVYAADSYSVTISTDKQIYSEGQTVIVKVRLSNINSSNGIYGVTGTLDYKTDVFEEIISDDNGYTSSITGLNGWGNMSYNSNDKSFQITSTIPAKSSQEIMQIALKVKEGAPTGRTVIMLSDLNASNNNDDITTTASPVYVTIQEKQDDVIQNIQIQTSPTPQPSPSPVVIASPTPTNNKLPQTGIDDTIVPLLFGTLIISLVSYVAYRRYKGI